MKLETEANRELNLMKAYEVLKSYLYQWQPVFYEAKNARYNGFVLDK